MKKVLVILLLSITGFSVARAQISPDTTGKKALKMQPEAEEKNMPKKKARNLSPTRNLKQRSASQIRNMKNGVLLVRLRTSEIAIRNLKKSGNEKMAATLQRQQDAANQRIIYAFQKQFSFCPVFFFYSSDTDKVKAGKTSGFFLNNQLQVDPNLAIPDTNYFVAEITELEQFRANPDSPEESVNAEVSFKALVIRDYKFHQLAKPFPFFIKAASNFPPRKRSEVEMVDMLDARLEAYYKSTLSKAEKK